MHVNPQASTVSCRAGKRLSTFHYFLQEVNGKVSPADSDSRLCRVRQTPLTVFFLGWTVGDIAAAKRMRTRVLIMIMNIRIRVGREL